MVVTKWLCLVLMTRVMAAENLTKCQEDALLFNIGLNNSEKWALQMFDSATKLPDGLLYGNVNQLGNFDECVEVRAPEFQGKYCRASVYVTLRGSPMSPSPVINESTLMVKPAVFKRMLGVTTTLKSEHPILMTWSLCAPSSCSASEVQDLLPVSVGGISLKLASQITDENCYTETTTSFIKPRDIFIVFLLVLLSVLVIAATIVEMVRPSLEWRVVTVLSVRSTAEQLFTTTCQEGEISCLHGLRVGSMLWIIMGHRYSSILVQGFPMSNYFMAAQWLGEVSSQTVIGGFLGVDTFFFMSGLLMCYVFLRDVASGSPFNIIKFYGYRYIRLAPPMLVVIMLYIAVLPYLGSGPLWNTVVTPMSDNCAEQWWINALYVHNFIKTPTMCLPQTWYLAVDMQLAWLSPLVLLPLVRVPKRCALGLLALTLISCFIPFTLTYIFKFPWSYDLVNKVPVDGDSFFKYIYMAPYSRATPYIVGILIGNLLHRTADRVIDISKWLVCAGWLLSIAMCLSVIYTLNIAYQPDYQYNRLDAAFYAGFHRLGWSLGLAWIVFACAKGHGWLVNSALSLRMWAPLGRLCYGAYLAQFIVIDIDIATTRNSSFFSDFNSIHTFLGDVPLVYGLALLLYIFVEGPATSGLRMLLKKGSIKGPPSDEVIVVETGQ